MRVVSIPGVSAFQRKNFFNWRCLFTLFAVAVLVNFGCATDVLAQTYRGRVVDAETGQPLEGAVFVIVWSKKPRVTMNGPEYFHSAKEALTDAKGEFFVDGSPGIDWNPFTYILKTPRIGIFMPGYGPFPTGHVKEVPRDEIVRGMTDKSAVVKLPKLKSQEEMLRYSGPHSLDIPSDAPNEATPNVIRLLNIHRKRAGLSSQFEEPAR